MEGVLDAKAEVVDPRLVVAHRVPGEVCRRIDPTEAGRSGVGGGHTVHLVGTALLALNSYT